MKTKDLIAMLQKADPEGNCHVRLPGGDAIYFAERKEGYWDGPYMYLDGEHIGSGTLVVSIAGDKIDLHAVDIHTLAEIYHGDEEKALQHLRFEGFERYSWRPQAEEHMNRWKNTLREACKEYRDIIEKLDKHRTIVFNGLAQQSPKL